MRIVVCVKHVPDIQSERSLQADGRMVRDGGDGTLNELDENAVEAALALVEEHGGEVVAVTVGPDDAVDAARRALQMGAEQAVHVLDDAIAGSDVFGTATVLAAVVRRLGDQESVDLVVTGMAGLDGLTSLLPSALATELGLPLLALAAEVRVEDGAVRVRRELDHATEVLEAPLPALVSVTDQANEPRYPNFKGIMAARKKPVDVLTLADLGIEPQSVGAAGARTEVLEAAARPPREDRVLVTDDGEAGLRLAAYLVENKLV
ncbi:electron transfer flavoprotein subunit beta/FixA family protein [Cellulomonas chengniuliangii]|uniref:Electron transfer flavoprotein subunit beta n=1 Tax=Cellulomonas chengniuliangii TaxID=2968084 RepID=A0ABY5L3M1_9CELL|nr:electron transfer flavoprotein subunit beta/FixA family protein [Cellulomonas chengniuliangii]MCC2309841.1 electron transfer flavoprotein subunit beta/FixA family protein [Cellulomonas chengniuliangii]MCC2318100.1 electron transfer flavoprotein subunit beta/FixA family protein [Cellulomonas chengniuliangii]UUI76286.1 electron transfer flavoprotein subunit beta/FixA family protein [Cellulomonas chengniuliangii]